MGPVAGLRLHRRVEFAETDLAGIVHFSNLFRYAEAAETELFARVGLPVLDDRVDEAFGWPRVRASAEFSAPLRLHDVVEVVLRLAEIRERSLHWDVVLHRLDPAAGTTPPRDLPPAVLVAPRTDDPADPASAVPDGPPLPSGWEGARRVRAATIGLATVHVRLDRRAGEMRSRRFPAGLVERLAVAEGARRLA